MIALLLTRWRIGLSLAAGLALIGLIAALSHYRHAYHNARDGRIADRVAYANAQADAARIARDALTHQEAVYRAKAQDADHAHALELADARTATDRYIAAHRVRSQVAGSASGTTSTAAARDGSGVPARVPSNGVMVAESDVHACTEAVIYANKAHDWALSLENNHVAEERVQ